MSSLVLRTRIIFASLALVGSIAFAGLYGVYLYQTHEAEYILSHPNVYKGWILALSCTIMPIILIVGIVLRHRTPAWLELVIIAMLFGAQLGNCLYNFVIGEDFVALEACVHSSNICQELWGQLFASGSASVWLFLLFVTDMIAILGTNKSKVGQQKSVWKTPIGTHHLTAMNGMYDHESLIKENGRAWEVRQSELYQPHQEIYHPTYHQQVPYNQQAEIHQPKH